MSLEMETIFLEKSLRKLAQRSKMTYTERSALLKKKNAERREAHKAMGHK